MHGELELSNVIVSIQIADLLLIIVRIIDLDLKLFTLLKVEVDHDLRNPLRIQIVVNDLSLAHLLPNISLQLVENDKRLRL